MAQDSLPNQPDQKNTQVVVSGYRLISGLGRGNTSRVYLAEKVGAEKVGAAKAEADSSVAEQLEAENTTIETGASGAGSALAVRPSTVKPGTRLALKLPLPETLADQSAAESFANEVRLTLQFRHPNLVSGIEGTPFGPDAYLAMHFYPSGTLARQLTVGRLSLSTSLQVLADVASGLAHLHENDAVHQDVKTQNVYLEALEEAGTFRASLGDFGSTYFQAQGGKVSGSPFYMAPEIYQGEMTGPPSDVYSFGVLAYELLSGKRPHLGDSYEQLMISHLTHFPPPLKVLGLSKSLGRLLGTALSKRPEDRPSSEMLRQALLQIISRPKTDTDAEPEDAERKTALGRSSAGRSGRHGAEGNASGTTETQAATPQAQKPSAAAPRAPTPPAGRSAQNPSGRAAPKPASFLEQASAELDKRGWNPFKKKK